MAGEHTTEKSVQLNYRLTVAEMAEAVRMQRRKTPAGRRQLIGSPIMAALGLSFVVVRLLDGAAVTDTVVLLMLVASLILILLTLFLPQLSARQLLKLNAPHGELRTVVSRSGAKTTSGGSAKPTTVSWDIVTRYTETDELFVLLSADKNAVGLTVLPKRGTRRPADVDRLRALLDQHLERV
ncbi:YcxB family protein [Streptomyces sp. NPDC055078]